MLSLDWAPLTQHGDWAVETAAKACHRRNLQLPDPEKIEAQIYLDGVVTTAIVRSTGTKKIASGAAMRSPRDSEDRLVGMRIALTRALVALDIELF